MFKTDISRIFLVFSIIGLHAFSGLFGQVEEHELPSLRKISIEEFESGDYDFAAASFGKLLRQFPEDPMYRYYSGICKVELNTDLGQAAELLYFASSRGVPVDVFYYLGEAHRKLYDFEKARKYYTQFDNEASRSSSKERNSKLLIRSAIRAKQICSSYNPFEVLNVTFLDMNDPAQYGQIRMRGGDLSRKPESLFAEREDKNELNVLMFFPKKLERGEQIFFSGMEKSGKNGYQIMQAK
ncbi:MAG: hypothetical protein PF450_09430 [Bacteroidales bacterium]|jgi:tetratricopeptide (TPR) repeat protein|nr:hypothetical protein [Bacteroidales bacterium]